MLISTAVNGQNGNSALLGPRPWLGIFRGNNARLGELFGGYADRHRTTPPPLPRGHWKPANVSGLSACKLFRGEARVDEMNTNEEEAAMER